MSHHEKQRGGYTMVELSITMLISIIVLGASMLAIDAGAGIFQQSIANSLLTSRATGGINRIAEAVTGAGLSTVMPRTVAPMSTSSISFQRVVGYQSFAPVWSDVFSIELEMDPGEVDNGLDDDGDGYVDECQVVLVRRLGRPDEDRTVIAKHVSEYLEGELPDGGDNNDNGLEDERGLSFDLRGGLLVIRLSTQGKNPDGRVSTKTLSTAIVTRNE